MINVGAIIKAHKSRNFIIPRTPITVGVEVEFYNPTRMLQCPVCRNDKESYEIRMIAKFSYNFHQDYAAVFEMVTPPMALTWPPRKEDIIAMAVVELLVYATGGYRVSEYEDPDDERTCGSHHHFRATSSLVMARMHNWAAILSPLLSPLIVLARRAESDEDYNVSITEAGVDVVFFRRMFGHYVTKPLLVDSSLVEEADRSIVSFRGYEMDSSENEFRLVEPNKYRKPVLTIEYRAPENHVLSVFYVGSVLAAYSNYPVPPVDLDGVYNSHPTYPVRVRDLAVKYGLLKDTRVLKDVMTPVDVLEKAAEICYKPYCEPIEEALKEVRMGRRLTWGWYNRRLKQLAEMYELKDLAQALDEVTAEYEELRF